MDMDYVRSPSVGECGFKGRKGEEREREGRTGIQLRRVYIGASEKAGVFQEVDRDASDGGCEKAAAPGPPLQRNADLGRPAIDLCPLFPETACNTGPEGSKNPRVHSKVPERCGERTRNIGKTSHF